MINKDLGEVNFDEKQKFSFIKFARKLYSWVFDIFMWNEKFGVKGANENL